MLECLKLKGELFMKLPDPREGLFEEKSAEFFLKEYECLRKELELLIQESRALERYVLVAVGVVWSWLYHEHEPWGTFLVVCLFPILGAIRAYGINKTFGEFGTYIESIEIAFKRKEGPLGWEHANREGTPDSKGAVIFWALLNASTLLVAILRLCHVF